MRALLGLMLLASSTCLAIGQEIDAPLQVGLAYAQNFSRLSINVAIGDSSQSAPYLFDTGSSPFTSVWSSGAPWWPANTMAGTPGTPLTYGPANGQVQFDIDYSRQTVSVAGGNLSASLSANQIVAGYTNLNRPDVNPANWQPNTTFDNAILTAVSDANQAPPIPYHPFQVVNNDYATGFNGIMGANLESLSYGGFSALVNGQTYGNGLTKGFIVDAALTGPSVTVGLKPSVMAGFTNTYAMNVVDGSIQEDLINANFSISGIVSADFANVPTLLDTGTPPETGVNLFTGSILDIPADDLVTVDGSLILAYGESITIYIGDTPYTLTSELFSPINVYTNGRNPLGSVTYGLNFFQNYKVMYDLADDMVGIEAVPESSQYGFLAFLAVAALIAKRRIFPARRHS